VTILSRAVLSIYRIFHFLHAGTQIVVEGILLGLPGDQTADATTEQSYGAGSSYTNDGYLDSGFQFWEQLAVQKHFKAGTRVLVAAAGGGREMIALSRAGFGADGFDCSRAMVETGVRALAARGISGRFTWAPPCQVPALEGTYDGLIVGWNGYTYILPRARRIAFLRALRAHLEPGAAILISGAWSPASPSVVWTAKVANAVRICTFRKPEFETGDAFPGRRRKGFSRGQIDREVAEAGLSVIENYRWGPFFAVVCRNL
jgi:hypothetical protein